MGMGHHQTYYFAYYPSYSYGTSTDQAIAPLSYIKATTPEFVALQSGYQKLQQQVNQTQSQNRQLQITASQQSAAINQLNQQLAS
jgi:NADH:ubiquinone oxidoreductase subunit B-like Fe-S oxidoreductase